MIQITHKIFVPILLMSMQLLSTSNAHAASIPAAGDWTEKGTAISEGSSGAWDSRLEGSISPATVVKKGGTYFLYYVGADGNRSDGGPANRRLGVATSTDGINFTKYAGNPILIPSNPSNADAAVFSAGAFVDDNGDIIMYYSDCDGVVNCGIHLATSSDGLNFTDGGIVVAWDASVWGAGDELFPVGALKANNKYYIYYIAKNYNFEWQAGVAWGDSASNITNSASILTDGQIIGGFDPVKLNDTQVAMFVLRNFASSYTVDVRTVDINNPTSLGSSAGTYTMNTLHMTPLYDAGTDTWLLYYLSTAGDKIMVKAAGAGSITIPPSSGTPTQTPSLPAKPAGIAITRE